MERPYSLIRVGYGWKGAFLFGGRVNSQANWYRPFAVALDGGRIIRRWRSEGGGKKKKKQRILCTPFDETRRMNRVRSNWATGSRWEVDWNGESADFYPLLAIGNLNRLFNIAKIFECRVIIKQILYFSFKHFELLDDWIDLSIRCNWGRVIFVSLSFQIRRIFRNGWRWKSYNWINYDSLVSFFM